MTNSYLTKIGHNEFRIDFKTEVSSPIIKTVIVDGEEYTKTIPHSYFFDSVSDFENASEIKHTWGVERNYVDAKGYWRKIAIDVFKPINNQTYYIWDYVGFSYNASESLMGMTSSTDGFVRMLFSLVFGGFVKYVLDINTEKSNEYTKKDIRYNSIIKNRGVDIYIYSYGFNNCVSISVNFYTLLKIDFVNIKDTYFYSQVQSLSNDYPDLIPSKILYKKISDIERNEIAINILNKSINLKQKSL